VTRIVVIGSWQNAFVTAACMAKLGHAVVLLKESGEPWAFRPSLNLKEPGLDELLDRSWVGSMPGMLHYGHLTTHAWKAGDVAWMAIDTPLGPDDAPLLEPLRQAASCVPAEHLLVVSSQVPVGFCSRLSKGPPSRRVVCVPENLRIGDGVRTFLEPDRLVIGGDADDRAFVSSLLSGLPVTPLLCDLVTAEMVKHATNAFLATSISLANELAWVGEAYGADNDMVAKALRADSRVGPRAYVKPGLGFSGGTLPRDLRALQAAAHSRAHRGAPTQLIDAVCSVNDNVLHDVVEKILTYNARTVTLLGYTYKPDTDTLRGSPAIILCDQLRAAGLTVHGYDPRMRGLPPSGIREAYAVEQLGVRRRDSMAPAVIPVADVYVVVTALPEFRALRWCPQQEVGAPNIVFDLCGGVDPKSVLDAGLSYKAIWQPMQKGMTP